MVEPRLPLLLNHGGVNWYLSTHLHHDQFPSPFISDISLQRALIWHSLLAELFGCCCLLQHFISPVKCTTSQIRIKAGGGGDISQHVVHWQTTTFPRKFVSLASCMPHARCSAGNRWFPECPRAEFWRAASSPRGAWRREGGREGGAHVVSPTNFCLTL